MKELTKAEEQIMQELWQLQSAYVKDIIEQLPEPKPAYNTVSTIVRILERKGFVSHKTSGKSHLYYPIVQKDHYKKVLSYCAKRPLQKSICKAFCKGLFCQFLSKYGVFFC